MLDFQIQQAPMRLGLAEGVDPHQVPFGTLTMAENACWDRSGCIRKRLGTANLTTSIVGGGSISAALRLITRGSELALTDGAHLYSYTSSGWIDRGRHPEIGLDWSTSVDAATGVTTSDLAVLSNGQVVEAWVTGDPAIPATGSLYYQIRDITSGVVITAPTLVSSSATPRIRLVASGTTWVLLWATAGGALEATTSAGTSTLKSDATSGISVCLDACVIGTDFVVAYSLAAGGIRLIRYSIATTPVQAATSVVTGFAGSALTISVGGASGETLYIAYYDATALAVKFAAANPATMVQTVAPTTVQATGAGATTPVTVALTRETSTTCLLVYSFGNAAVPIGFTSSVSITNAGAITTGQTTYFMRPISRPFLVGSRFYCVLATDALAAAFASTGMITNSDTFLVDVTSGGVSTETFRQVGKIDALIGGCWARGFVCNPCQVSSTITVLPACFQSTPATGREGVRQGVRFVRATSGASLPADMWRSVQVGPEAYLAAGVLTAYDGVEALGYGWAHGPYIDSASTATSTVGGAIANGTYLYNVTAERRSGAGVLHRSPVGVAVSYVLTGGGTSSVTAAVVASSLGHATKIPGQFVFYRTVVNGTVLQRIAVEPSSMTIRDSGLTYPATAVDTRADGGIGTNSSLLLSARPALYTEGGELEDTQPQSCLTLTVHGPRIWMLTGDKRTVAISKDYTSNPSTAPGFYPTVTLTFEDTLTALGSLDDKLIAFAASTFWYVVGDGPAPNGQGSSFQIGAVQTDVGCTTPRSIASVPMGLLFQSSRGLYLLSRKLEVSWIGRPVKDELAAYPNITSAVVVASRNEVRWTANNSDGSAGIVIVYNYVEDQWTTSRYTVGGVYGAPIADACMWNGVWTFVTTTGQVCTEDSTTYLDSGSTWVPLTLETAWISAAGPLAYQSVRMFALEGVANSNHDLTISAAFDNETSYVQTKTFAAGTPVTAIGPLESCEISIGTRRKCQAIRFKIQDATPTSPSTYPVGTGQGPSFDMLGIEVGLKRGLRPKPAGKTG